MTDHVQYEELAAGHALRALEPEDEQLFLRHLAECARCEQVLAEHERTAADLAYAAGAAELPEGLFARVRDRVVAESGEQAFTAPAPVSAAVGSSSRWGAATGSARLARLGRSRPRLAAAAVVAVLLGGLGVSTGALLHDRQQQLAESDRLSAAVAAVSAGPARTVPLVDDTHRVRAVAVLRDDRDVALVLEGLAPNDPARSTYVLWELGRYGDVRAVGTFDVRDAGVEVVRGLPLHGRPDALAGFAITREPGRTPPARTVQAPVAVGSVEVT